MTGAAAGGLVRVAALALIWGSGFLWIKICLRGFTPVQLTWGRLALGALVLVAFLGATRVRLPPGRRLWGHLAVAALLGNALPYLLFGIAETQVSSALAGAINTTTPLWTLGFALLLGTERRVTLARAAGLLLGFVGALLILAPWERTDSSQVVGALLCLAAAAFYGVSYVYIGRYLSGTGFSPVVLSAVQMGAATAWLTPALLLDRLDVPAWRGDAVASLLVLGVVGTGFAYVLNYRIIADDGPLLASTVTYLLPAVAVALGALVLGESLTLRALGGVALVLGGVVLTRRRDDPGTDVNPRRAPRPRRRRPGPARTSRRS